MLSSFERQHIEVNFPQIDPNQVVSRLGMGIEKVAFALRAMRDGVKGQVLKLLRHRTQIDPISLVVSPIFTSSADAAERDADTCQEYFGNAVVVPQIIRATKGDAYCVLQDMLDMEMLTPQLLQKHPSLLQQLHELLQQDAQLQSDQRKFFDFQGWDLWRVIFDQIAMANVAVIWEEQKPKLKIFDLTLMRTPASISSVAHMPAFFSNQRNNRRMIETGSAA